MINELTKQNNWYCKLLEDLKELAFKGISVIKWQIGDRILQDFDKFGTPKYGEKKIEGLARDLDVSSQDIWFCIAYRRKFSNALENVSWRDIIKQLPEPKEKVETPPLPKGKYQVIYADPPWKYNDECKEGAIQSGGAIKHYPVMSIEELCLLPIPSTDNAVLFLWTTSPLLEESFKVINAWGFKYKSSFVWDKVKHNMGHYNSVRHEFLLVCIRGQYTPENPKLYDSVYSEEKKEHSKKPEKFYEIIETLYPNKTYLELFARTKRKGWMSWGNEIND